MARLVGSSITTLTYNAKSLLPDCKGFNCPTDSDVEDTTTFSDGGYHTFTGTLKGGGDITLDMLYNNQASTSEGYLFFTSNIGVSNTFSWADGTRTFSISAIVTKVDGNFKPGELIKNAVTLKETGTWSIS